MASLYYFTASSSQFFNKTDLELHLFKADSSLLKKILGTAKYSWAESENLTCFFFEFIFCRRCKVC